MVRPMHTVESMLPSLGILGASEFWVTKWVTPLWLLGTGVAAGLILLAISVAILRGLSFIPLFDLLQKNRKAAHVVALLIAVALGGSLFVLGCPLFADQTQVIEMQKNETSGYSQALSPNKEQVMYGLAITLLAVVISWGLIFGSMPKHTKELFGYLTDGISSYFLIWCGVWILIAAGTTPLVDDPVATLKATPKVFNSGIEKQPVVVESSEKDEKGNDKLQLADELAFNPSLLYRIQITTDKPILIADEETADKFEMPPLRVEPGQVVDWVRGNGETPPFSLEPGAGIYLLNLDKTPANVLFTLSTIPPIPETRMIPITAFAIFFLGFAMIAQNAVAPKLSAVALATAKSELAQPLFLVLLFLGIVAIVTFVFLPFYTLGEDTKSLKECGITVILVLAIFQGVWAASGSVSDEIEGRTALTVLSKPIQRRSFVIGKFLGIFWVLLLMFAILGSFELISVSYKPLFEARETSEGVPSWQGCFLEVSRTIPGLVMALMQATILSAISVAVSTRLPQLANFAVCFGIYLVGNLTPTLVGSSDQQFEIVRFVAQLIAVVIPILDHFNMQAAIDANNAIPYSLLCGNLVYTGLYVALAMFIALLFFEDRDLA